MRSSPRQAGANPFRDARALELGDRRQDVHLQLAGRRRGVDALGERHERDAERLQLLEQRHEVPQVAAKPVEPPDHEDVEPAPPSVRTSWSSAGRRSFAPETPRST